MTKLLPARENVRQSTRAMFDQPTMKMTRVLVHEEQSRKSKSTETRLGSHTVHLPPVELVGTRRHGHGHGHGVAVDRLSQSVPAPPKAPLGLLIISRPLLDKAPLQLPHCAHCHMIFDLTLNTSNAHNAQSECSSCSKKFCTSCLWSQSPTKGSTSTADATNAKVHCRACARDARKRNRTQQFTVSRAQLRKNAAPKGEDRKKTEWDRIELRENLSHEEMMKRVRDKLNFKRRKPGNRTRHRMPSLAKIETTKQFIDDHRHILYS